MAVLRLRLRANLRTGWRSWLGRAVLLGVVGGVVLLTAAGARRTDTAYARLLRFSRGADVVVSPQNTGLTGYYAALSRLPGVEALGADVGIALFPHVSPPQLILADSSADGEFLRTVERPKLLEGRMFDPARADEAVAEYHVASQYHLHPGSVLQVLAAPTTPSGIDVAHGRELELRIVGVAVTRDDVISVNALGQQPALLTPPAFLSQFDPSAFAFDGAYVRLRPGSSIPAFQAAAEALAARFPDTGTQLFVADEHQQAAAVERGIRPQATALALFSLFLAVAGLVIVGQLAAGQVATGAAGHPALRALGMTRAQLAVASLVEVALVAVAGALLAAVLAAAASPLTPIGAARLAEPAPGVAVNWLVLSVGAVAIVSLVLTWVVLPAWRWASRGSERSDDGADRRPGVVEWLGSRLGPATSIGLRLGRRQTRVGGAAGMPGALAAAVVAVGALAAAVTFGANLTRLVTTPRLYGQTWGLAVDTQFGIVPQDQVESYLRSQPGVAGWTFGEHAALNAGGVDIPAIALAPGQGSILWPFILEGRAPTSPDELLLGSKTLQAIGRRVGDEIAVTTRGDAASRTMRVVGRAVFPFFGEGTFTPTGLGVGAAFLDAQQDPAGFNFFLAAFSTGATHLRPVEQDLHANGICPQDQVCDVFTAQRPLDIRNYASIQATPRALAAVLAVVALATLAQVLVASTGRRQRDLAVLKTLGFVRRQVAGVVVWQATALVLAGLLVGLPLGVATGRWLWALFADRLGVPPTPVVPVWLLVAAVPVTLVVADALAAGPALLAARRPPGPALRAE